MLNLDLVSKMLRDPFVLNCLVTCILMPNKAFRFMWNLMLQFIIPVLVSSALSTNPVSIPKAQKHGNIVIAAVISTPLLPDTDNFGVCELEGFDLSPSGPLVPCSFLDERWAVVCLQSFIFRTECVYTFNAPVTLAKSNRCQMTSVCSNYKKSLLVHSRWIDCDAPADAASLPAGNASKVRRLILPIP